MGRCCLGRPLGLQLLGFPFPVVGHSLLPLLAHLSVLKQCMSSGLIPELRELSNRADRLKAEVVDLAESIAELLKPGQFGDWVLVDGPFCPLPPPEFRIYLASIQLQGVVNGPPQLPEECLRQAERALEGEQSFVARRAQRAFLGGFEGRFAIENGTPFQQVPVGEGKVFHWLIVSRRNPNLHRRVTSKKCLDIAVSVEKDSIWQGFRSLTELSIFCCGLGIVVPRLERWISPW